MTYALRTCKDGDLFGLRWKRDERAVVPSYASEGTRKPTSGGSKSSYSRRLCRPSLKRAPSDPYNQCVTRLLLLPTVWAVPRALLPWYLYFYLITDCHNYK